MRRITSQERDWGIQQYRLLQSFIESGSWEYSSSKLKSELESFKFTTWFEVHPVLTVFIFLIGIPLGFVPLILLCVVFLIHKGRRENYELHLAKLKNRTIHAPHSINNPSQSDSMSTEIGRLNDLRKEGVISLAEFESAKAALISKAS